MFLYLDVFLGKFLWGYFETFKFKMSLLYALEGTARYAGLLLAPAEGFGLRPRLFFGKKKEGFYAVFAYFRPFLVFSSNLSNF